jgi:hypothetical protein
LALIAVFAIAFLPVRASAQSECGYFAGSCEGTGHFFNYDSSNSCFPHTYCAWCMGGACHPMCGDCGSLFSLNPLRNLNVEALLTAAAAGNLDRVLQMSSVVPGYVAFNRERGSVQIRSCSGATLAANLPPRTKSQIAIASRLPSPDAIIAAARAADRNAALLAWATERFGLRSSSQD